MKIIVFTLALLSLPLAAAAQVQTVWRCGAEGRSYSTAPCAGGRALESATPPSVAEQNAARLVAVREQRLAEQMRNDRLRAEAVAQRNALFGFRTTPPGPPSPPVRASARPGRQRPTEAVDIWRAAAPASRRARG